MPRRIEESDPAVLVLHAVSADVLGDLPGLGVLFRQRSTQDDKAELLIFVTPTILEENDGYN